MATVSYKYFSSYCSRQVLQESVTSEPSEAIEKSFSMVGTRKPPDAQRPSHAWREADRAKLVRLFVVGERALQQCG